MPEMVKLTDVSKSFGGLEVLKNLNMVVSKGEVVSIIGPSGAGKSTILRCINALEPIDSGQIHLEGVLFDPKKTNVHKYREQIGFVFQSFNLFPHLTVRRNVTLAPLMLKKASKQEMQERAAELLASVGLADKVDAYPNELSGGQRQRVAIARALAMDPKVLLLDEITSALDPELTGEVLKVVSDLAKKGMTMILVTHEIAFARDISDRVLFFESGRIVEEGDPETIFKNPSNERTKRFLANFRK
jgi:ABC-type polar amino acid transport system ATPase subunit